MAPSREPAAALPTFALACQTYLLRLDLARQDNLIGLAPITNQD